MKSLINIRKSSVMVFTDQALYSGSNFLLTFLLARTLSIQEFGIYSYVLIGSYFILNIGNALIIQPYQIMVSKSPHCESLGFISKVSAGFLLFLIILLSLIYLFLKFPPKPSLSMENSEFLAVHYGEAAIFILGYFIQDFFRKSLLAIQELPAVLCIDLLFLCVFPLIICASLTLGKVLLIIGVGNLLSSLPGILYFLKNAVFPISDKPYLQYYKSNGKWFLYSALLQWFSGNFLVLISGLYLGLEALAALRLAQSFFGIFNVILQTVENFFLPKTARLYHKDTNEAKEFLFSIKRYGFFILGPVLLLIFIFSEEIMILFGGTQYQHFGYVIKLMSLLYLLIFWGYPVRIAVRVTELNKIFFYGYIFSTVFILTIFHFLLKYTALYGAITGLMMSQIILILYWKLQLRKNNSSLWK